jgi:hypothetical protein
MASPDTSQPPTNPPSQNSGPNAAAANTNSPSAIQSAVKQLYTCPMHPEVISDHSGKCPKCGMNLVPVNDETK